MRVLVVFAEPVAAETLRERCLPLLAGGHEPAICCVVPTDATLKLVLDTQRDATRVLRSALDGSAEAIPVFVVTQREGDGIDDCAAAWGATEVQA